MFLAATWPRVVIVRFLYAYKINNNRLPMCVIFDICPPLFVSHHANSPDTGRRARVGGNSYIYYNKVYVSANPIG